MKSLLVAAGLFVGASAWAEDYYTIATVDGVNTTTMNFNVYSGTVARTQSVPTTLGSTEITTSQSQKVYPVNDYSDFKMFNYIAMASNYGIRRGSSATPGSTSTSDGIFCAAKSTYYVSITNLHVGDRVRVTCSDGITVRSGNATYDKEGVATNTTSIVDESEVYANANVGELTIVSGSQLDLQMGRDAKSNLSIGSITIVSNYDAVSTPTLEQTAAGTTSTILITAGVSNNSGATVTTYYTTDGSTPSAENYEGSFTGASKSIDITSNKTIKAVSTTSGTYGGSSYVISGDFTAEEATLNAPSISLTGFALSSGIYHPVYSFVSDQSDVPGYTDQTLTYSYTLAGGESVESERCTATSKGKLVVTVAATGFKSNSAEIEISTVDFLKTYSFDASTVTVADGTGTVANDATVNGAGCHFYDLSGCTYDIRNDFELVSGFSFAWKITANQPCGFYTRTGSGKMNFGLESGEYIEFVGASKILTGVTTYTFGQWTLISGINIYSPFIESVSPTVDDYVTFSSKYPLNFATATGVQAYVATSSDGSVVTMEKVTGAVPANTGLLLQKVDGEVSIPVVAEGVAPAANLLKPGTGAAVKSEGTTMRYVLAGTGEATSFYCLAEANAAVVIPVGKAYLEVVGAPARLAIVFEDGETTGIKSMNNVQSVMDNEVYNLQGQRVQNAVKGLYIVNGKKVVRR